MLNINKESAKKVWGATPAGSAFGEGANIGTKEFFENVIKKRSSYEMPWLKEVIPFKTSRNKKVLELGCGAGYDAYEFCRHGADYTGIDITPENIQRTKKHLSFFNYQPAILEGDAEVLNFDNQIFDIVYSNGVLHHTPNISKSFNEAFRVLKNGGFFWVIVYHKNSIFYRISLFLTDHLLKLGFLKRSFKERVSMMEYTTSNKLPLVNAYSRKEVRNLLENAGFMVKSLQVRKLVSDDLPIIPLLSRLWKYIPQSWLDYVGRRFGWYVIAKAEKPIN